MCLDEVALDAHVGLFLRYQPVENHIPQWDKRSVFSKRFFCDFSAANDSPHVPLHLARDSSETGLGVFLQLAQVGLLLSHLFNFPPQSTLLLLLLGCFVEHLFWITGR